jgi:hypothetical protein
MPSDRKIRSQFNRQREEIDRKYSHKLSATTGFGQGQVRLDYDREIQEWIYRLWSFESVKLLRQADRYDVKTSNPDWYVDSDFTEGDKEILTENAQRELRRLIRIERRAHIEWWITKAVLPILQSIAAIIGVLIGLVAILKN